MRAKEAIDADESIQGVSNSKAIEPKAGNSSDCLLSPDTDTLKEQPHEVARNTEQAGPSREDARNTGPSRLHLVDSSDSSEAGSSDGSDSDGSDCGSGPHYDSCDNDICSSYEELIRMAIDLVDRIQARERGVGQGRQVFLSLGSVLTNDPEFTVCIAAAGTQVTTKSMEKAISNKKRIIENFFEEDGGAFFFEGLGAAGANERSITYEMLWTS